VVALDFEGGASVGVDFAFVGAFSGEAFEFAGASSEGPGSGDGRGGAFFGGGGALVADEVLVAVGHRPHSTPRALVTVPVVSANSTMLLSLVWLPPISKGFVQVQ